MDNLAIKKIVKKALYFFSCFLFLYCANIKSNKKSIKTYDLSNEEKNVVNTLLETELTNKVYKHHLNDSIIIITEAFTKKQVIEVYESFLKNYKNSFIDSIQIANLKKSLEKEPIYYWKKSDFYNKRVALQTREDLEKSIRNEDYLYLPDRLIFHISTPFFIDKNKALITFMSGSAKLGTGINSSLVLVEKDANGKWITKYLGSNSS